MSKNQKVIEILKNLRKNKESITIEKIQNEYIQLYKDEITHSKIRKILYISNYRSLKGTNSPTWNGKTYFHKSDVVLFLKKELKNINENYPDRGFAIIAHSEIKDLLSSFCIKSIDILVCSEMDINSYSYSYTFYKMKIKLIKKRYSTIIKKEINKIKKTSNLDITIKMQRNFPNVINVHSDYKDDIILLKESLNDLNLLWFNSSTSMILNIPFNISLSFEKDIADYKNFDHFEDFDFSCYTTIRERFVEFLEEKYPIEKNSKENDKIPEINEIAVSSESGES